MILRQKRLMSLTVTAILAAGAAVAGTGPTALAARLTATAGSAPSPCLVPAPHAVIVAGPGAHARPSGLVGAPPAAVIRVDQLGYPSTASKLAEIMTTRRSAGIGWELVRRGSCQVVAHGIARTDLGSWSHRYSEVLAVRFSGVRGPGTYRLALAGHPATVSPWFRIAPSSRLYAGALANALSFYQNERDGPAYLPSALRTGPGHLNDASAMTFRAPSVSPNGNFRGSLRRYATGVRIDATGGWFDAGDYLKFTETTSYTVAMMLQGIASFPAELGGQGHRHGHVSFTAEARFGLDFLQRMWHERTKTLYLQVGTGEANNYYVADHDIWRLPQADDGYHGTDPHYQYIRHPPVFRAGPPGAPVSPNLAGRLAAAFALCYRVFRVSDPSYAARCLRSAETVYSMAATRWKGKLRTVLPWDFYPEASWRDDMMLGATELALALDSAGQARNLPAGLPVRSAGAYLAAAARWASQWMNSKASGRDTLNLYDVSALADYELYRAIGAASSGATARTGAARPAASTAQRLAVTQAALLRDLRAQIRLATGIAAGDPFGFGFAWDQWDTTAHGLGLSVMASEYDRLVGRPVYPAWGQRWLDDVLGANAWGVSLIVGDGTVFPDCMQHQVANLAGSPDGTLPILAGAVVEGPNSYAATGSVPNMRPCAANAPGGVPYSAFRGHLAVFRDNVQSYSTVEPAIDLTALSPLAFAWQAWTGEGGY